MGDSKTGKPVIKRKKPAKVKPEKKLKVKKEAATTNQRRPTSSRNKAVKKSKTHGGGLFNFLKNYNEYLQFLKDSKEAGTNIVRDIEEYQKIQMEYGTLFHTIDQNPEKLYLYTEQINNLNARFEAFLQKTKQI